MPYIIQANTPEEMRTALVKWLEYNATVNRIRANMINTGKNKIARQLAIATTYEDAAKFVAAIVIERHA